MITLNVTPAQVIKSVYDMCIPVGMGFMRYVPGDMDAETAKGVAARIGNKGNYALDYLGGRQCKFGFKSDGSSCTFDDTDWYDHTLEDLKVLISTLKQLEA